MITTKLMGGMGNQMFQYAAGRHLALLNNTNLKLDAVFLLDRSIKWDHTLYEYELDVLNIRSTVQKKANKIGDKLEKIFRPSAVVLEVPFTYDPSVLDKRGNIYLHGFWQSELYFKAIESTIRKEFEFVVAPDQQNAECLEQIHSTNSVSMHFRRGDYVNLAETNQFHGVSGIDYYKAAMVDIKKKVKDPHFFVFSNDLDWVKDNMTFDDAHTFVDHNPGRKSYEDLRLMINCKHNVIANSSFSWWAAWLNNNPEKIIIAPARWFNDEETTKKAGYMIPESWIRL